jgi:hypothetical protein
VANASAMGTCRSSRVRGGRVQPDPATPPRADWAYREQLAWAGTIEWLFAEFDALLRAEGSPTIGGHRRYPFGTYNPNPTSSGGGAGLPCLISAAPNESEWMSFSKLPFAFRRRGISVGSPFRVAIARA